ncbi:TerD family protein [Thiococcus pfennigii]|jgi:tellurium resistance protein TerD|uniref:TerD family protein n=1 Tax=Thiococcus pfennigii TaxID=1057 RepID=UPI001906A225|nr:TerD family protein [Thiococcus pfennigii]MBK1702366.1 chemical-damaging agent resistance protein C [Thiococcus pfennigii]MBK1733142.1 chemical-damaging agent resistance protein C [Thiococcus pfennigii]
MGVTLEKGGRVSLDKAAPGLRLVHVGLGWDPRVTDGKDFDLDASAFLLGENGKVAADKDFIFYNNLESTDGSVRHTGDNLTGAGEGDDEVIMVDLPAVPANVHKIAFTVTIHDAQARGQNFGQVANAFIRLVDADKGTEVVRFDLGEDYSTETAMVFAELYRHGGEWRFNAVGQGYAGGLHAMCGQYGVRV